MSMRKYITVDVDVDIEEFDDEDTLERAREIAGHAFDVDPDIKGIAQRAYLAIATHDHAAEVRESRELIGAILGRIL